MARRYSRRVGRRSSKRRFARRYRRRRFIRRRRGNVYFFRRSAALVAGVVANASGYVFSATQINGITSVATVLGQTITMPAVSDFSNLFDYYKLHSLDIYIIPRFDNDVIAGELPTLYWLFDSNDAAAASSVAQLMERGGVKSRRLKSPLHLRIKVPCVANRVYNGASDAYTRIRAPWIAMDNGADCVHYGMKTGLIGEPNQQYNFDIRVRWNFWCKNTR